MYPLHDAAYNGQSEVVLELIKHGAEKDILAGGYCTPLHQTASQCHLQTVKALLDEGCIISVADKNGRTPLHWISNIDHLEVVRELISRGCPVDITDKNGETPLHHLQDLMEEGKSVPQCRIAIVGTFKDELMKCSKHNEVITSLNARLEGLCKNMHSSLTFITNDQSNDNERCLFLHGQQSFV